MSPRRSARTTTANATAKAEEQDSTKPATKTPPSKRKVKAEDSPPSPKKQKSEESPKTAKPSRNRTGGSDGPNAKPGEPSSERFLTSMKTMEHLERTHGLLESGEIYFVYRPRVMVDEASSFKDVARLHMLLIPSDPKTSDGSKPHRLILIGKKHLPKARKSGRPEVLWGEVLEVGDDLAQLQERLGPYSYDTKTRGERHVGAARVAGRGHYVLNCSADNPAPKNSKNMSAVYKTYLAYSLSVPHTLGEVQKDFNIEQEGAMVISVKEPNAPSNNPAVRDTPANRKPKYPAPLKKLFTTKFTPANPRSLLDFAGAEVLLIPSSHSVEDNVGKDVKEAELSPKKEEEEESDAEGLQAAKAALAKVGVQATSTLEGHWS